MSAGNATLSAAIERRDWELVALALLLGVSRAARRLPPETLDHLVEELTDGLEAPPRRKRRCRERR